MTEATPTLTRAAAYSIRTVFLQVFDFMQADVGLAAAP